MKSPHPTDVEPLKQATSPQGAVVDALWEHPVKSCAAVSVDELRLTAAGPARDRRWMWVDPATSRFVSQRRAPELALVRATLVPGGLELRFGAEEAALYVPEPPPSAPLVEVDVWADRCSAVDAGDAAAHWLRSHLNLSGRLVRQRGRRVRTSTVAQASRPRDEAAPAAAVTHEVSFADGYGVLVATAAAVAQVAARAGRAADARRFRPNVVVAGAPAFAEDQWSTIALGDAVLQLVKPCARCSVLDVDPVTGARDPGMLAALHPDRGRDGALLFGMNAVVLQPGRVRRGDVVRVLSRRD